MQGIRAVVQTPVLHGRRSSIEIIFEMLAACDEGTVNKTAVMYRSGLNHTQLRRYLHFLEFQELLSFTEDGRLWLTPKGRRILLQLSRVIRLLGDLNAA